MQKRRTYITVGLTIAVLLAVTCIVISCADEGKKDAEEKIRAAIEANNEKFMAALSDGDAAAVAALYTAEARLLPPNAEMMKGVQAVQAFWRGGMDMGIKGATLETVEVQVGGDIACEVGKYTMIIQPTADQTITDKGKYVILWKNENGSWKLDVDIWNTSLHATQ